MEEHVAAGAIVIDHHKSHEAEVRSFGARGVYGRETESGAFLAWSRVWRPLAAERSDAEQKAAAAFALLACVRDTWQREHPWWTDACEVAEALAFYDWATYWSHLARPFWDAPSFGGADALNRLLEVGRPLRERRLARARQAALEALHTTSVQGTTIAIVNTLDTSDVTDFMGVAGADVLVGFSCFGLDDGKPRVRFSLRARRSYDVGALCKLYGGGGHRAAAGFTVEMPAKTSIVEHVRSLVNGYETTT